MRTTIAALLTLMSLTVQADEPTQTVWYCTEVASTGLTWKDGAWERTSYKMQRYTVKQLGDELSLPFDMGINPLTICESRQVVIGDPSEAIAITCSWHGIVQFSLNTHTGKATLSKGYGWLGTGGSYGRLPYDLYVSALKCEKF